MTTQTLRRAEVQTPRHTHHAAPRRETPAVVKAAGIAIALAIVIAVMTIAFGLPAAKSTPHDVPIGVAGPQVATEQIANQLGDRSPGSFAVHTYADDAALRDAILDRQVYGGIALGPDGADLLIATGGSPMIAQMLGQIGNDMAQQTGVHLHTEDLAPPAAADPRGAGLAASALPITLAGMMPAILLVLLLPTQIWTRFGTALVFAPMIGITVAGLLRHAFGSIDAHFWAVAGSLTLGVTASLLLIMGLGSLFGKVGLAIGGVLSFLLGNPLSGMTSAPEFLPGNWGAVGQLLPQGATATLLRSAAYFSGAGGTAAIVVLTCWSVVGVGLIAIAGLRAHGVRA